MLSPLISPFDNDAPLCEQELLHANNMPFRLPTKTSVLSTEYALIEFSWISVLLQILKSIANKRKKK